MSEAGRRLPPELLHFETAIPIQIRAGVTVFVQGIPFDMTIAEAEKVAGVIQAMVNALPPTPTHSRPADGR